MIAKNWCIISINGPKIQVFIPRNLPKMRQITNLSAVVKLLSTKYQHQQLLGWYPLQPGSSLKLKSERHNFWQTSYMRVSFTRHQCKICREEWTNQQLTDEAIRLLFNFFLRILIHHNFFFHHKARSLAQDEHKENKEVATSLQNCHLPPCLRCHECVTRVSVQLTAGVTE